MTRRLTTNAVRHALVAVFLTGLLVGCGPAVDPTGSATGAATGSAPAEALPIATPTPSPTPELGWDAVIVGDAPFLDYPAIDGVRHLLVGALLRDGDTVHGWVVAFRTEAGDQTPYHVTWQLGAGAVSTIEPVEIDAGIDLSDPGPIPQSVVHESDGTFTMYGWGTVAAEERRPVIWRATAETPDGPWPADPGVIFLPATRNAWDGARIDFPTVLSGPSGGHVMVYEGSSAAYPNVSHIGIARSSDGIAWSQADVPVLSPGLCGHGDQASIYGPRALALETGLLVAYLGNDGTTTRGIYLAEAQPDGSWDCQSPAPVVITAAFGSTGGFHSFAAFEDGGVPYVLVEVLSADAATSGLWLVRLDPVAP